MKKVPCLAATLFFGVLFTAATRADDPRNTDPVHPVLTDSDILALQDPDGVPVVISHPRPKKISQAAIDAQNNQAQKEISDKDWMMRGYQQQLQLRATKAPGSEDNNLLYRISTDKDLSKLAGVTPIDPTVDPTAELKTGAQGKTALKLRPDAAPSVTANPTSSLFKPLITPLGATDAAGLHNFYGSLPAVTQAMVSKNKKAEAEINSADLDMPGKVAAESDPMPNDSLTFDNLPDDALPEQQHSHGMGISKIELPITTNAGQIEKLTDSALGIHGTKTAAAVNVTSLQLKLAADPPTVKLTPPSPVRQPISNPFNILDH